MRGVSVVVGLGLVLVAEGCEEALAGDPEIAARLPPQL
ncbi:hypothetical protein DB32_003229 [Sandaracinus amylolyticus]|uniref:Uncharacterized protein n=1 Tax=Sandaracinus amylolyticus TaxID=927083 RepID=A0A0F6W2Z6_9BACT|nr:hypothetical protein DB32_003229 [Sandaracinus amylolyticus]